MKNPNPHKDSNFMGVVLQLVRNIKPKRKLS